VFGFGGSIGFAHRIQKDLTDMMRTGDRVSGY